MKNCIQNCCSLPSLTLIPALPFCKITLTAQKPTNILQNPKTWGERIKKRRLELRLLQAQVAEIIGVTESTITNWEKHRSEPMLWVMPKVIEFLDYEPNISSVKSLGQRIKAYRLTKGMTQKELARQLEVDPTTLARWEMDKNRPVGKKYKTIFTLLKSKLKNSIIDNLGGNLK
jgi:transcriptional regulator with XRE-family HTH domain